MFRPRETDLDSLHPATRAVIAGRPRHPGGPLNEPPVFASAFGAGADPGYARQSNPTWEALEDALGALDGGSAVAFASGMAAAAAIIESLPAGARIVVDRRAYPETRAQIGRLADRGALIPIAVDATDTEAVLAALDGADALWADAVSNPELRIPELDTILPAAAARGVVSIVDATLATPLLLRPLELGADVVLHSATKYIGGHSDLVLGAAVCADRARADELRRIRTAAGSIPGTMEAWLALRGLRTLPLRIERGATSAAELARLLAERGDVAAVHYPGLPSHPGHLTASRLMPSFGAVVSFDVSSSVRADDICARVELITHAGSLGGVETLIERQAKWHADPGLSPSLLRLSVGCEDPADLWSDLERAL